MSAKHTPGPCGCDLYRADVLCPLHAAAPELLEALRDLRLNAPLTGALVSDDNHPPRSCPCPFHRAIRAADAAIAKAEGR